MNPRQLRTAAAAALVVVIASCGGSAHPAATASPAASRPVSGAAQAISAGAAQECSLFAVADSRISSDTASDTTVGQLDQSVSANWRTWTHLLTTAGKLPASVPKDQNAATRVNSAILIAGIDETRLAGDSTGGLNFIRQIKPQWHKLTRDLAKVTAECAAS